MSRHRLLRAPVLSRYPDPERSRDPQVRELVSTLTTLEPAPPPRARFRAELRTQLLALAPSYLEHPADRPSQRARNPRVAAISRRVRADLGAGAEPTAGTTRTSKTATARFARPLAFLTCTVAVLALLLGGAVLLSRNALPGDALYGLKRASENVHEAVTDSGSDKGKLLLSFASDRYSEVGDLLPRSGSLGSGIQADSGQIDSSTASLVRSTLASADDDVRQGMQSLGAQAIESRSGSVMKVVLGWYPAPMTEMGGIVARIPSGSLHNRAESSLVLLRSATQRAHLLSALGDCACLSGAPTDDLGPLPCTDCAPPNAPAPGRSGTPTTSAAPSPGTQATSGSASGSSVPTAAKSTGAPTSGPARGGSGNQSKSTGGAASDPTGPAPPPDSPTVSIPVTPQPPLPSLPELTSLPVTDSLPPPPPSSASSSASSAAASSSAASSSAAAAAAAANAAGSPDDCAPAIDAATADISTCAVTSEPRLMLIGG